MRGKSCNSELKVLKSAAGYYIGREITAEDGICMPYDRQSKYFRHVMYAEIMLTEIEESKKVSSVQEKEGPIGE